ncbi:MAG: thiamine phosphate synthase [Thiohalomonadales bacterium]
MMRPLNNRLDGLYIITPLLAAAEESGYRATEKKWQTQVQDAISGGASVLQFRDKSKDHQNRLAIASWLLALCHANNIPLIINDDVVLAKKIHADGVHLGRHDMSVKQARSLLGAEAIIGVSCYNRISLAISAQIAGADYVAFGRFFPSATKPDAVQAPISILSEARKKLPIPIVAIGGITVENASTVIQAGATSISVIDAVFAQQDTYQAARNLKNCFG